MTRVTKEVKMFHCENVFRIVFPELGRVIEIERDDAAVQITLKDSDQDWMSRRFRPSDYTSGGLRSIANSFAMVATQSTPDPNLVRLILRHIR
jgi:hypothetical protein